MIRAEGREIAAMPTAHVRELAFVLGEYDRHLMRLASGAMGSNARNLQASR